MSFFGPRDRLLEKGPHALSEQELLAVLVGTGAPCAQKRLGAEVLADDLLLRFGGLKGLFSASQTEFRTVRGLGPVKIARLLAVRELFHRLCRPEPSKSIRSIEEAVGIFSALSWEASEALAVAFLNTQNRVLHLEKVFQGTLGGSLAHPREILRAALRWNAARILVAHNHPSGVVEPSWEDRDFTARLVQACQTVGIPLLDHLIVAPGRQYFSFSELGMLQPVAEVAEAVLEKTRLPTTR